MIGHKWVVAVTPIEKLVEQQIKLSRSEQILNHKRLLDRAINGIILCLRLTQLPRFMQYCVPFSGCLSAEVISSLGT